MSITGHDQNFLVRRSPDEFCKCDFSTPMHSLLISADVNACPFCNKSKKNMPETPKLIPCKKCSAKTAKEVFHAAPACEGFSPAKERVAFYGLEYVPILENDSYPAICFVERENVEKFIGFLKQMDATTELMCDPDWTAPEGWKCKRCHSRYLASQDPKNTVCDVQMRMENQEKEK